MIQADDRLKLEPRSCPVCKVDARGIIETVRGCALLQFAADGSARYGGETDMWWEEQRAEKDAEGRITLICGEGHEWQATLRGGDA